MSLSSLPTLFSENFRGPPTNFGKFAGNLGKLENLQRTSQKSGTSGEPPATPRFSGNFRGTSRERPNNLRGTSGDLRGTSGDLRGTSGNFREPPRNLRGPPGTSGEPPGTSGDLRGTSGDLRGTSGDLRGTSGHLRGPPGNLRGCPGTSGRGIFGVQRHFSFKNHEFGQNLQISCPVRFFCVFHVFLRFSRFFRHFAFFFGFCADQRARSVWFFCSSAWHWNTEVVIVVEKEPKTQETQMVQSTVSN